MFYAVKLGPKGRCVFWPLVELFGSFGSVVRVLCVVEDSSEVQSLWVCCFANLASVENIRWTAVVLCGLRPLKWSVCIRRYLLLG